MSVGFSAPIFFVFFREATEAAIIISILLSFVDSVFVGKSDAKTRLLRQIWLGTILGLLLSVSLGVVVIVVWFTYASNLW
jgi:high-affinity iron transporter